MLIFKKIFSLVFLCCLTILFTDCSGGECVNCKGNDDNNIPKALVVISESTVSVKVNANRTLPILFTTSKDNTLRKLQITGNVLANLTTNYPGWSSTSSSFSCDNIDNSNKCLLNLKFSPTNANQDGTLILPFTYQDNQGAVQNGKLSIIYNATSNNNVFGTVTPSLPINVVVNGTQTINIIFNTDDGQTATDFQITGNTLANLNSTNNGWSSTESSFSCNTITLNHSSICSLQLKFAPTDANQDGVLTIPFSYKDDSNTYKTGTVTIPYNATVSNNIQANPSSQVVKVALNDSQTIGITFKTDDGQIATNFEVDAADLKNLSTTNPGWSSTSPSSFQCATVTNSNACFLNLTYSPTTIPPLNSSLTLNFSYLDNSGVSKRGLVNIAYSSANLDNLAPESITNNTVMTYTNKHTTPKTISLITTDNTKVTVSTNGNYCLNTTIPSGGTCNFILSPNNLNSLANVKVTITDSNGKADIFPLTASNASSATFSLDNVRYLLIKYLWNTESFDLAVGFSSITPPTTGFPIVNFPTNWNNCLGTICSSAQIINYNGTTLMSWAGNNYPSGEHDVWIDLWQLPTGTESFTYSLWGNWFRSISNSITIGFETYMDGTIFSLDQSLKKFVPNYNYINAVSINTKVTTITPVSLSLKGVFCSYSKPFIKGQSNDGVCQISGN